MDWMDATARVVVAGCEPHPDDVALVLGWADGAVARALAEGVREVVVVDSGAAPADLPANVRWARGDVRAPPVPEGVSIVAMHWTFRRLVPADQKALLKRVAAILPERGLFVVGDVMWSLPVEMLDEPGQYAEDVTNAPATADLERWSRDTGFLPDLHRFGPGVAVLIALKAPK